MTTSRKYDVAIIGGGILGAATAMKLTAAYPKYKVAVIEKEKELAAHQTGHNSGVIHSGLYYRPGSYKASLCVQGGKDLRAFCDQRGIRYDLIGKVVVATSEAELPALQTLYERGTANGVEGLAMLGPEQLREIEPHTAGMKALHCPMTGIIDYKEVTHAYATQMREQGGDLFTGAKVQKIHGGHGSITLETTQGDFEANHLINCGGLYADTALRMMGVKTEVRIIPFRGEYYEIAPDKHHLVKGLIYPVPNPLFPFLGVHYTRLIHGGVEAGPNAVLALAREGYTKGKIRPSEVMDYLTFPGFWRMSRKYWKTGLGEMYRSFSKKAFTKALQKLLPEIRQEDLVPAGAGVRAQAVDRTGFLLDDFSIVERQNAIHVLNAPSPAATSSLAIGQHIVNLAAKSFGLTA
ncbi:MAG: L-2-hydroxyglutarate oxidase [Chloroflexi bacterium]|nr:L-2-hydroxyglutarate oxidase [Chloroflexota bacterium]